MGSRRFILAALAAGMFLTAAAGPSFAKKPDPAPAPGEEQPLTPQEQASSDRKMAAAERYVASMESSGGDLVSLACFVPNSTDPGEGASLEAVTAEVSITEWTDSELEPTFAEGARTGAEDASAATIVANACQPPQGFLAVEARDQIFGHYCGPAVGQVIANYSWAMPAGRNVYLQRRIAEWMSTDVLGQTTAFTMERGLETATLGSPRRPANWDWIVTVLGDFDGDGWMGDQLDAIVRTNISHSRMPLAIPVKPHDDNSPSGAHLFSWPNAVNSIGHWVAIYGWIHVHDGTDLARMYYTDSSRDEGGATGKFWTPTRWFTLLMIEHTRRLVW